jgi:hypothetical protein
VVSVGRCSRLTNKQLTDAFCCRLRVGSWTRIRQFWQNSGTEAFDSLTFDEKGFVQTSNVSSYDDQWRRKKLELNFTARYHGEEKPTEVLIGFRSVAMICTTILHWLGCENNGMIEHRSECQCDLRLPRSSRTVLDPRLGDT